MGVGDEKSRSSGPNPVTYLGEGLVVKTAFLAWIDYHRRSDLLAQHLGATTYFIQHGAPGGLIKTAIRYLVQAWRSWRVLSKDRPDIVFVQNPPIFCVVVAALYAKRYGAEYVIDSHTGAFLSPKWRWSLRLHRLLSSGALATIVHNTAQEQIVKPWGCRYLVMGFTPGRYPPGDTYDLDGNFCVAVISSFRDDEPLGEVFGAAALMPDVRFYITGDATRIQASLAARKPDNVLLTGYLSYDRYVGLLRGVDAMVVLTTGDHQLLMGGFEAVSLGKPLIVSDWPLLRTYFHQGTVYVTNTAEGISEGIRQAQRDLPVLQQAILALSAELHTEWEGAIAQLRCLLEAPKAKADGGKPEKLQP